MQSNKRLKAFTIIELLVSMTLTGILIAFAFMGYNQIQKLFINYAKQSEFISEYNQLNKALFILANNAELVEKEGDKSLSFKSESSSTIFEMNENVCLLRFNSHTDTFHISAKEIQYEYVKLSGDDNSNLICFFDCEVLFQSQKFHVSFHKEYAAASILKLNQELLPKDELY